MPDRYIVICCYSSDFALECRLACEFEVLLIDKWWSQSTKFRCLAMLSTWDFVLMSCARTYLLISMVVSGFGNLVVRLGFSAILAWSELKIVDLNAILAILKFAIVINSNAASRIFQCWAGLILVIFEWFLWFSSEFGGFWVRSGVGFILMNYVGWILISKCSFLQFLWFFSIFTRFEMYIGLDKSEICNFRDFFKNSRFFQKWPFWRFWNLVN